MAERLKQTQERVTVDALHPLAIYNAFPRDFVSAEQLIQYLPTIVRIGCDVVWINPIQECTASRFYNRPSKLTGETIRVKDSLYAMTDPVRTLPGWDIASIQRLTTAANGLGMDMMFDLVLNHVGKDAIMVRDHKTRHLFINGKFNDTMDFNYEDPAVRREAIAFWKDYITRYIGTYGFSGIRLDAVRLVHPEIQREIIEHANECVRRLGQLKAEQIELRIAVLQQSNPGAPIPETLLHQRELAQKWVERGALIFGEFLFGNEAKREDEISRLSAGGLQGSYDVLTNSIYYGVSSPLRYADIANFKGWTIGEMRDKGQLTRIGTVGFTGNHDERPLLLECAARLAAQKTGQLQYLEQSLNWQEAIRRMEVLYPTINTILQDIAADPQSATAQELEKMMKQHIATVAFASDGGYYLLSGDEYGAPFPKNVFGTRQGGPLYPDGGGMAHGWGGNFDLRGFFQEINQTLKSLPIPREVYAFDICYPEDARAAKKGELHPREENLRCIVRATGNALDVIVVNTGGAPVVITPEHIANIHLQMQQYNPKLYKQYFSHPEKLFFHGVNGVIIPSTLGLQQRIIPHIEQAVLTTQVPTIAGQFTAAAAQFGQPSMPPQDQQSQRLVVSAYQQQQEDRPRLSIIRRQQLAPSTQPPLPGTSLQPK